MKTQFKLNELVCFYGVFGHVYSIEVSIENEEPQYTIELFDSTSLRPKLLYPTSPFENELTKGIHEENIDELAEMLTESHYHELCRRWVALNELDAHTSLDELAGLSDELEEERKVLLSIFNKL